MTCMYYSSRNLCGVTPNHTLYNEINIYPKWQRKSMTSAKTRHYGKNEIVNLKKFILIINI